MPNANRFYQSGADLWVLTIAVILVRSYNALQNLLTKTSGWWIQKND